jgi:hypothetical protein
MAKKRALTEFEPVSLARLNPLVDCLGPINTNDPSQAEWWLGILSCRTIVYGSGRIAWEGDPVRHKVDSDELARCRSLATEAQFTGDPGGLASEGEFQWYPFFIAANLDDPIPERIDEALVRERFGGTILPIASVVVGPLAERGVWWSLAIKGLRYDADMTAKRVEVDGEVWWQRSLSAARTLHERGLSVVEEGKAERLEVDQILRVLKDPGDSSPGRSTSTRDAQRLLQLLKFIDLFRRPVFKDAAYVAIGDVRRTPTKEQWPPGLAAWPSCMPRLLVGLTQGGSLAGLISHVVSS